MTRQKTARPEERAEEEKSMALVPMRAVIGEREKAELRVAYVGARQDAAEIQQYAANLKLRPGALKSAIEAIEKNLAEIRARHPPVLGGAYNNIFSTIDAEMANASHASAGGQFGNAVGSLDHVNAMLDGYVRVLGIATGTLNGGVPLNASVNGMESGPTMDAFLDSLGWAVITLGTQNHALGENVLHTASLYSNNVPLYNVDDPAVSAERDAVFGFVIERGQQAKAGRAYTADQERADRDAIIKFEANLQAIAEQVKGRNIAFLTGAANQVDMLLMHTTSEQGMNRLKELKADMEKALDKLRRNQQVEDQVMRDIAGRYMLAMGLSPAASDEEAITRLTSLAKEMRGTKRELKEDSPEWFAAKALSALDAGDRQMAGLALSLGILQRDAMAAGLKAQDYLRNYAAMRDAVDKGLQLTPAMLLTFTSMIDFASIAIGMDRLAAEHAKGAGDADQRITNAVLAARQRFDNGDMEGVSRLHAMLLTYADLLEEHKGKAWPGREKMESAIDDEIRGQAGAAERYNAAAMQHRIYDEAERMSSSLMLDIKERRALFDGALQRARTLADQGKAEEAIKVLTLAAFYADSASKLGQRRNNRIVSFSAEDSALMDGMEKALAAAAQGGAKVGREAIDDVFGKSYAASQAAYAEREADRISKLSARMNYGSKDIGAALTTARERAKAGDAIGANTLLQYVKDYYGEAGEGRKEGWRYEQLVSDPRRAAAKEILQAIRMETGATDSAAHMAAGRRFAQGAAALSALQSLLAMQAEARALGEIYGGRQTYPGALEPGRIPLGARRPDGSYAAYASTEEMRAYDKEGMLLSILDKMAAAAAKRDKEEYQKLREWFWMRFGEVVAGVQREKAIDQAQATLRQADKALENCALMYGRYGETARAASLASLRKDNAAMVRKLESMRRTEEELPMGGITPILERVRNELGIAAGYEQIRVDIANNKAFIKFLGGSDKFRADMHLTEANLALQEASRAILRGDLNTVATEYLKAVNKSVLAMKAYEAKAAGPSPTYERYQEFRIKALDARMTGSLSPGEIDRMSTGARTIEESIFTIPAGEASQIFADYSARQRRARELVNSGDMAEAQLVLRDMRENVEYNKKWARYAVDYAALGVMVVSPLAGTAILTTQQWDNILEEYKTTGTVSAGNWAMLAAMPLIAGGAGLAATLARDAAAMEAAGAVSPALKTWSRILGVGTGAAAISFTGAILYDAGHKLYNGEYAEGLALAGLGLLPVAAAAGVRAGRIIPSRRAAARAELENALDVAARPAYETPGYAERYDRSRHGLLVGERQITTERLQREAWERRYALIEDESIPVEKRLLMREEQTKVLEQVQQSREAAGEGAAAPSLRERITRKIRTAQEYVGLREKAGNKAEIPSTDEVAFQVGAALDQTLEAVRLKDQDAVKRIAEIVKALDREATLSGDRRHHDVLRRLFYQEGVPEALQQLATADPELRGAIKTIEDATRNAAKDKKISVPSFIDSFSREGIPDDDVTLILDACGRDAAKRGMDPVDLSQYLLYIKFTPAEKAVVVVDFESKNIVSKQAVLNEANNAARNAEQIINGLSASGNPILEAVKAGLIERVDNGGNLESVMLETLKSTEVVKAVEKKYGLEAAEAFAKKMAEASKMDDVLKKKEAKAGAGQPPEITLADDLKDPLQDFWKALETPELKQQLNAVGKMKGRTLEVRKEVAEEASVLAQQARPILPRMWRWTRETGMWGLEHAVWWGPKNFYQEIAKGVKLSGKVKRAVSPAGKYALAQLAIWGALYGTGYLAKPYAVNIYELISGAATVKEGVAMCKERYGVACSEENATWIVRKGLSTQAQLRAVIHDALFTTVRDGIIEAAGGTLKGSQLKDVDSALLSAEKRLNAYVAKAYEDTDEGRKRLEKDIKLALGSLTGEMAEKIGATIKGAEQAKIEKTISDAGGKLIKEFQSAQHPGYLTSKWRELWGGSNDGAMFYAYIVNALPAGEQVRPQTREELQGLLQKEFYDIRRIDELLTDGRQMSGELGDINGWLADRAKGGTALNTKAEIEAKLDGVLKPWGITLQAVDALLKKKGKETLDITDMAELRMGDWKKRGLILTYADLAAQNFLAGTGAASKSEVLTGKLELQNEMAARLLRWYPDAFWLLLDAVGMGNIPAVYTADVMTDLYGTTGLTTRQQLENRRKTAPAIDVLRKGAASPEQFQGLILQRLKSAGLYIEPPIVYGSFLGMLDQNTLVNPSLREPVKKIFDEYQNSPVAMAGFNSFVLKPGETVYGDPAELAKLIADVSVQRAIAADKSKSNGERDAARASLATLGALTRDGKDVDLVALARQKGFVGPAVLADIDPEMLRAENRELVSYAVQRTVLDADQGATKGLIRWLADNREAVQGNVVGILRSLAAQGTVVPEGRQNPETLNTYLNQQARFYRDRGLWNANIPLPSERRAERPGLAWEKSAEEKLRESLAPKPVRLPYERVRPAVAVTPQATSVSKAEVRAFFSMSENADLMALADGGVNNYYNGKGPNKMMIRGLFDKEEDAAAAFRARIYADITDKNKRKELGQNGISVTEQAGGLQAKVVDPAKASSYINTTLMLGFLSAEKRKKGSGANTAR